MNFELYQKLMNERPTPAQHSPEWKQFLGICDLHLKQHNIKNPVVVELGILKNRQKRFYEQLFGAEHIGIDSSTKRCIPDIHGFTDDKETLKKLKEKLAGRPINILFIDAAHRYKYVKSDFEMYHPLCSDIVAFHDIETGRHKPRGKHEVWLFWDEMKRLQYDDRTIYKDYLFISIRQCRLKKNHPHVVGIGLMIKRG